MSNQPYQFQTQKKQGKAGEAFLAAYFAPTYDIAPSSEAEQRWEIDFWFTNRKTGNRFGVEIKTDAIAGKTGNAFVEIESVHEKGKPGWALMSRAEYLIYYIPEPEAIYAIPFEALRRCLPRWRSAYPSRNVVNDGYTTVGILVPLHEFEKIATQVY